MHVQKAENGNSWWNTVFVVLSKAIRECIAIIVSHLRFLSDASPSSFTTLLSICSLMHTSVLICWVKFPWLTIKTSTFSNVVTILGWIYSFLLGHGSYDFKYSPDLADRVIKGSLWSWKYSLNSERSSELIKSIG